MIKCGSLVQVVQHHCAGDRHTLWMVDTVVKLCDWAYGGVLIPYCGHCYRDIEIVETYCVLASMRQPDEWMEEWVPVSWLREIPPPAAAVQKRTEETADA